MVDQHRRQAPGAVGDVGPAEAPVAEDDALAFGDGGGDGLVQGRDVELHEAVGQSRARWVTVTESMVSPTAMAWATSMPSTT